MIPSDQIRAGRTFLAEGQRPRHVLRVVDGIVEYRVSGVLTRIAKRAPVSDFARWAERATD